VNPDPINRPTTTSVYNEVHPDRPFALPPTSGPNPNRDPFIYPMSMGEKAAKSKTFNTLDLRIDQALDKTWMAKEEFDRLVTAKTDQLTADDATELRTQLEAAAAAILAARAIVWKAAENA
jgi:hypothetical protein